MFDVVVGEAFVHAVEEVVDDLFRGREFGEWCPYADLLIGESELRHALPPDFDAVFMEKLGGEVCYVWPFEGYF